MLNTSGKQVLAFFQKKIPVFCVIWRLVIICLHLGSITSLFLFCFKHCNMFFESASGQNRYKKNPQNPASFITKSTRKNKNQNQQAASNSCKGIITCPTERYTATLPSPNISVLLSELIMGINVSAYGLSTELYSPDWPYQKQIAFIFYS